MKIAIGGVDKERIGGNIAVQSGWVAADSSKNETGSAEDVVVFEYRGSVVVVSAAIDGILALRRNDDVVDQLGACVESFGINSRPLPGVVSCNRVVHHKGAARLIRDSPVDSTSTAGVVPGDQVVDDQGIGLIDHRYPAPFRTRA